MAKESNLDFFPPSHIEHEVRMRARERIAKANIKIV